MDFNTETAWMVRSDGEAFPCVCHIYGSKEDIEETLFAAEWLYQHTALKSTQQLCLRFIKSFGVSLSEHRNCVRSILLKIKDTPYRFLDCDFINDLSDKIQDAPTGFLDTLNNQVNTALNNEFMRVRYGGMYDSEDGNRDLYFRLSNEGLLTDDWERIIQKIIGEYKNEIDSVIIVSDKESTGECKRLFLTEKK